MVQDKSQNTSDPTQFADDSFASPREISCRVTSATIKYLESNGYDTKSLFDNLPFNRQYLIDPLNWISRAVRETICQRAVGLTQNASVMYLVGLSSAQLNANGGVEQLVKPLGNPELAYRYIPKYAAMFDRSVRFSSMITGTNKATITMSMIDFSEASKNGCYYAQGALAAIPTIWGLPPAEVTETLCMSICGPVADQDADIPKGTCCTYEVTWQSLPSLRKRLQDKVFMRNRDRAVAIARMEDNFAALAAWKD